MSVIQTSYDVIVVGAGSMGMSAGYYVAKQGARTLLLDAFDPPHLAGSHNGETRLMRHAYKSYPVYTELAIRADALWAELERLTGESLLVRSGVLDFGPAEGTAIMQKRQTAEEYGLAVELLDAGEISKRWKGIRVPDSYVGLYEQNAGYLKSEECVRAYKRQALSQRAVVQPNTPVTKIETGNGSVTVHTDNGVYHAAQLILSLGAWFSTVEQFIALPIQPVRKVVAWFEADPSLFDSAAFPGFTLEGAQGRFYGFPSIGGVGVKIGRHDSGRLWQPGQPFEQFGHYAEDEQELRQALQTFMPKAAGKLLKGGVCKYERTPDDHFIIDRHPEHANIWIAGGFSGHGFKFCSVVGELLADLVNNRTLKFDLSPFSLSRFTDK